MSGSEWQIINMTILRKLSKIAAFSNWLLVSAPDWLRDESLWRHYTVNLKTWHSIFHSWRHLKCLNIWSLQLEEILYLKTSSSSSKSSHWLLQESSRLQDFIKTSNLHDVFLGRLDSEGSTFSEQNVDSVGILKIENSRNWAYS